MARKSASKSSRKLVKRLPKLKGAELIEVTVRAPRKRDTKGKTRPIAKKELEGEE